MGDIQEALRAFQKITGYKYKFVVSYKKTAYDMELNFEEKDFRHMAGLHYLNDIDIPKAPKVLFDKIEGGKITDEYLSGSVNYIKMQDSYANVKNRISGLKYIEDFLDNHNLILKYVQYMNQYSSIDAEYMIKSVVERVTAYIFIRKRYRKEG